MRPPCSSWQVMETSLWLSEQCHSSVQQQAQNTGGGQELKTPTLRCNQQVCWSEGALLVSGSVREVCMARIKL